MAKKKRKRGPTKSRRPKPTVLQFDLAETFPHDDPIAVWLVTLSMGLNDIVWVNTRLIDGLDRNGPTHEHLYLTRLAALHVWELLEYLKDTTEELGIKAYLETLREEDRDTLAAILGSIKGEDAKSFRKTLAMARHGFAHYTELARANVPKAMADVAQDEPAAELQLGRLRDFRASYADQVSLQLLGLDEDGLRDFLRRFSRLTDDLFEFLQRALAARILGQGEKPA